MSSVRVAYWWADGSHMDAQCWSDDESPVSMEIARVNAVTALFEAMAEMDDTEDTDVLFPPEGIDGE